MNQPRRSFDPYRELGVLRSADSDQIKAAHRRLVKRFHPDSGTGDRGRFLAIQEAYQLLTDPLRRNEWDRRHAPGPVSAAHRAAHAPRPRPRRPGSGSASREGRSSRAGSGRDPAGTGSGRDPASRTYTWSAAGVPWWEDFRPRPRAGDAGTRTQAGDGDDAQRGTDPTRSGGDMDAYVRSSGAAWSMAARRHFRRA